MPVFKCCCVIIEFKVEIATGAHPYVITDNYILNGWLIMSF